MRHPRLLAAGLALAALIRPAAAQDTPAPVAPSAPADKPLFTNPAQPLDRRVDDLIGRMTLPEKVGQLVNGAPGLERLGLPAYNYWNEALHGVARAGTATVFPQTIGLGATWDTPLLKTIADTIATEARGKFNTELKTRGSARQYYGLTFWTPNINLFRDPRWGRGQETYGEDTFLTGRMGVAFIEGLQGDDPTYLKALACAKHYAVHSGPEPARHTFNAVPTETDFYDNYLPHFEAAVREAKVGCVMSAYNQVYGASATGSPLLLTDILRQRWGFQGYVVSDCDAVGDIYRTHHLVATAPEAAALALKSGDDLNCGNTFRSLTAAVTQGLVTEADINLALHRVLAGRFRLGMFDPADKVPFSKYSLADVDTPANSALALQAARESIVLLKNTGALPLDRAKLKRLAVIGPNADATVMLLGNYNGTPSKPVTILQGIRTAAGSGVQVDYASGCPTVPGVERLSRRGAAVAVPPAGPETPDFQAAVELARAADAVIFVGGISAQLEGEEMSVNLDGFAGGDRTRIELPAGQTALLQALQATGKPVVFVNCSGSAMAMPWEAEHLPAIVQAWYPGENGGTAVAEVLFGDRNPSGRLPVTFYRTTEDLPAFDDYRMANRTYRYFTGTPLYAFGHGLSYTKFQYSGLTVARASGTFARLSVDVANTGDRDGNEVVQVYAHAPGTGGPRQQLCAFKRVSVPKGGHVSVTLDVTPESIRRWDTEKKAYVIAPGIYAFQVGAASDDIRATGQLMLAAVALP